MLEVYIRPIYQHYIVHPLAKSLKSFSPDAVTGFACMVGVLSPVAFYYHHLLLATFLLLFSGYLDTLDGTLARLQNRQDKMGCVYDILSDRIVEASVLLGLLLISPQERAVYVFMMLASCYLCISAFLVVGVFTQNNAGKSFHYSIGLIERLEAFMLFILMMWLPHYFSLLSVTFTMLVTLTGLLHVKAFMRTSKERELDTEHPIKVIS